MSVRGKKVLVTGADGFIGSHLAERLAEDGAVVRALVFKSGLGWLKTSEKLSDIEIFTGNVTDAKTCQAAVSGCEIVYHLAAIASVPDGDSRPTELMETNVLGTLAVLDASRRHNVGRFVQASSAQTYAPMGSDPIQENHPLQARSAYAASKIAADSLVDAFHFRHGLSTVTLKLFSVFGPRQSPGSLVPTIIAQLRHDRVVRLGNLAARRDYVYVSDAVDAFVLASGAPDVSGMTFNIGGCTDISVESLAILIATVAGCEIEIVSETQRLRPPGQDVDRLIANPHNTTRVLGWKPMTELQEGLRRTINWYDATGGHGRGIADGGREATQRS